ncbi:MAG: universal stress protein [Caldilineaceae bacterium]|nr:universal stress protein [Caldilineaceae bacterium]
MNTIYDRILIPLDGSPLAELTFAHLRRLSLPNQTELHLVGVLETWRYAMSTPDLALTELHAYLRKDLQIYLAQKCQELQQLGYRVQIHQLEGDAALAIINVAKEVHAQLIAMTTHGRSGIRRWTLGSVAERVLHETDLPVLLVREETTAKGPVKRLLVPLDGSLVAEQALIPAAKLAKETGAVLVLLQVVQTLDPTNQRILFQSKAEAESTLNSWVLDGKNYLESVGQRLLQQGIQYESQIRTGDPDRVICATVVDSGTDMVVMGTHGRTGFRRWVYGSVANKVLRGVTCPLLLIRSETEETTAAARLSNVSSV